MSGSESTYEPIAVTGEARKDSMYPETYIPKEVLDLIAPVDVEEYQDELTAIKEAEEAIRMEERQ